MNYTNEELRQLESLRDRLGNVRPCCKKAVRLRRRIEEITARAIKRGPTLEEVLEKVIPTGQGGNDENENLSGTSR